MALYSYSLNMTCLAKRKMIQVKGDLGESHEFHFYNTISSCKYSLDGTYLIVGDYSGRIIIFYVDSDGQLQFSFEVEIVVVTQFQAHRGGHDWANREELKPSVVCLEWMPSNGSNMLMVSAGAKSIKFWKVSETQTKYLANEGGMVPFLLGKGTASYNPYQIKELPELHYSTITNINFSQNREYLLTTDGKTLLKWNTEKSNNPHLIATEHIELSVRELISKQGGMDIESPALSSSEQERLSEFIQQWHGLKFITQCRFHGAADNRMAYITKTGSINYMDMRFTNSTKPSILIETPTPNPFHKRFLNVFSDFVFLDDGYSVVTRDFLTVKFWDLRKPTQFTRKTSVFPSISWKVKDLFDEMHCIDQFSLALNGNKLLTNFFDCSFHQISLTGESNMRYRINDDNLCQTQRVKNVEVLDKFEPDPKVGCVDYNTDGVCCATIRDSVFVFRQDTASEV